MTNNYMSELINVKVDTKIKHKAQKVAADLGLSLSAVVNVYLRQFIRTSSLSVSLRAEEPTEFLLDALRASAEDKKKGRVHSFTRLAQAVKFLDRALK